MTSRIGFALFLFALIALPNAWGARESSPVQHFVSFGAAAQHYVDLRTIVSTNGESRLQVYMANWTPGSYKIRDHAKHLSRFEATDSRGRQLRSKKIAKNRWRIKTNGVSEVVISYRLYAAELTVRTNYVDEEFALLNGAAVFLQVPGREGERQQVSVELPQGWQRAVSSLSGKLLKRDTVFIAQNYDQLVDSPILVGNPSVSSFVVRGQSHRLVNVGDTRLWDNTAATQDLAALIEAQAEFWGGLPYTDGYTFFNLLVQKRGGLEHKSSTVMMTDRWATRTREGYLKWLNLASHEFFHTWNVKRLRPVAYGPFDYEKEVYSPDLWIAEGFTRYYQGLMLLRAGLITEKEYLKQLAKTLESVEKRPGAAEQSLSESSFDAWTKFYQSNEDSKNATVNYYARGAAVAFVLDARIRQFTANALSLDDVMRAAYKRFSARRGYKHKQFIAVVSDVGGTGVGDWLAKSVSEPGVLDYDPALAWFGLDLLREKVAEEAESSDAAEAAYLGLVLEKNQLNAIVSRVIEGFPARAAGISAGDEIVAINGFRVNHDNYPNRLDTLRPGEEIAVLVSRRLQLISKRLLPVTEPGKDWKLEGVEKESEAQAGHRSSWLAIPEISP